MVNQAPKATRQRVVQDSEPDLPDSRAYGLNHDGLLPPQGPSVIMEADGPGAE